MNGISLSNDLGVNQTKIDAWFQLLLRDARDKYSVDPDKLWSHTLSGLYQVFGGDKNYYVVAGNIITALYWASPTVYPDVIPCFDILSASGFGIGFITHATPKWTNLKLEASGLIRYKSNNKEVFTVPVSDKKLSTHWIDAVNHYDFGIKNTVGVGDDIKGDANAANFAGLPLSFWLKRNERVWGPIRDGTINTGVLTISSLLEIINNPEFVKMTSSKKSR